MNFRANKTRVEKITELVFGGTYFGDIYSGVMLNGTKKTWKEFDDLKNIDQKYYIILNYDYYYNYYLYYKYYIMLNSLLGIFFFIIFL